VDVVLETVKKSVVPETIENTRGKLLGDLRQKFDVGMTKLAGPAVPKESGKRRTPKKLAQFDTRWEEGGRIEQHFTWNARKVLRKAGKSAVD
jgi:hypothetical protein